MKIILPIAALAMLAACGQSASGDEQTKKAAAAPAGPHSNAGPGTFIMTSADGTMTTAFLKDDGTYTNWVAGEMKEAGKWSIENNKTCFTPDKGEKRCSSDGPIGPDGTWTSTPDTGAPYTVRKT
jgi:hypothetical protein